MWRLVNLKCAYVPTLSCRLFFVTLLNLQLHREDESCGESPVFFSLSLSTLFVVRHQHYFGAYDHLYQRVAYCNTHICCVYHSDDILGVCKQTVLVWQMFVLRMCNVPAGTALLAAQTVLDTRYCSCSIHLNDPEVHRWKDGRYVGGYQDNRSSF